MMSDKIRLERTEIEGYVTLTPQGRVFYTIAEYEQLKADHDRWCDLAGVMHQYIVDGAGDQALKTYEQVVFGD